MVDIQLKIKNNSIRIRVMLHATKYPNHSVIYLAVFSNLVLKLCSVIYLAVFSNLVLKLCSVIYLAVFSNLVLKLCSVIYLVMSLL